MKSKYRNEIRVLNYITSTEKYKGIFFASLILSLYGGFILGGSTDNFFSSILTPFQFHIFNIFLFALIFLNNMNACSIFKNDFSFYIMRLKNKKEYVKAIIRITVLMYLFRILIILLLIFICLLFSTFHNVTISAYQNYNITNLAYSFFYLIRYIILGLLLTIISTLIYTNASDKVVLIIQSIFLLLFLYLDNFQLEARTTFSLSIWSYFRNVIYETFSLEVASSILMIMILEIIIMLLYRVSLKNKKVAIS